MDIDTILKLAQVGSIPILLYILVNVWNELKEANKFQRDMLIELLSETKAARQENAHIMAAVNGKSENKET